MSGRQIVAHGPWIPVEVLQALEEGRLMLFCGAGISMGPEPWGLPDFRNLTVRAFQSCNEPMVGGLPSDTAAREAMCSGQYDKALEILETQEGHSGQMRGAIADILTSTEGLETAEERQQRLARHRALLDLAAVRDPATGQPQGYRLVTTNFDNRFELAGLDLTLNEDGPRLGPPSHERHGPLVHLHGRIVRDRPRSLDDLVLTTRDFGNAYLRHGWAARFVVEMFREFSVFFVGYSISDPVMRYLMDAFATERGAGRQFRPAFALVAFKGGATGDRERQEALWQAKRVEPILYDADHDPSRRHGLLDDTLVQWASDWRRGLAGRLKVAIDATAQPFQQGVDDAEPLNRLASVVWALDTAEGEVARRFAEHEPKPDITWFGPIVDRLARRPAPGQRGHAETAGVVASPVATVHSEAAWQLARWACRDLACKPLIEWAARSRGALFPELRQALHNTLTYEKNQAPDPYLRFWQLVLYMSNRRGDQGLPSGPHGQRETAQLLAELRPRLTVSRSDLEKFRQALGIDETNRVDTLADLGEFAVEHAGAHARVATKLHESAVQKGQPPPPLLVDAVDALTTVLVEWVELGAWAERPIEREGFPNNRPYLVRQRVDHRMNTDLDVLLDLLMAGFRSLADERPDEAVAVAARWRLLGTRPDHQILLRLWIWAATELSVVPATAVAELLLCRPAFLWSYELQPEVLRFLHLRSLALGRRVQARLGAALMRRPPIEVIPRPGVKETREYVLWLRDLRLWKLSLAGAALTGPAARRAAQISQGWRAQGVHEDCNEVHVTPTQEELAEHFAAHDASDLVSRPIADVVTAIEGRETHWSEARLAQDFAARRPDRAVELLRAMRAHGLSDDAGYNGVFWGLRSQVEKGADTSAYLAPVATAMNQDPELRRLCVHGAADWIRELVTRTELGPGESSHLWALWDQLVDIVIEPYDQGWGDEPWNAALNAPGGALAEALLHDEGRLGGPVGRGLSEQHRPRFDRLVEARGEIGIHGRVQLVSQIAWLHAVDPSWTEQRLLRRFHWSWPDPQETIRFWRTFAFFPRADATLIERLKPTLLDALGKRADLGDEAHGRLCQLLGLLAMQATTVLDHAQIVAALHAIGPKGCGKILWTFQCELRDAGSKAAQLWHERIAPWIEAHWPSDQELRCGQVARVAVEMALETRDAFPEALRLIKGKFLLGQIDDDPMWLFGLYHVGTDQYDYLAHHPQQVADLISVALSPKPATFAAHDIKQIVKRVRELYPNGSPPGWQPRLDTYGPG